MLDIIFKSRLSIRARALLSGVFFGLASQILLAHHSVSYYYDESAMQQMEVVVTEFRFTNPHPYLYGRIAESEESPDGVQGAGSALEFELDNRRELAALGITAESFVVGDEIFVAALPSSLDNDTFYIKVIEHPRLGFGYLHNVRQLFHLDEGFREYWLGAGVEYF